MSVNVKLYESEMDYEDSVREWMNGLAVDIAKERALAAEDVNRLRGMTRYQRYPDELQIMARKRWAECDIRTANMEIELLNLQRALEAVSLEVVAPSTPA